MRVPQEILNSTAFLGHRRMEGTSELRRYSATAFAVTVAGKGDVKHVYLVTARHAVESLVNCQQIIRVNGEGGVARQIEHDGKWWFHLDDHDVDVAVCPFSVEGLDISPIPTEMFLTDEAIVEYYIGPGDEVLLTGLFNKFRGDSKNLSIIRRGSLAMLPEEKIPNVTLGRGVAGDIDGYLIEVRSTGGLSGSPAFVRAPIGMNFNVFNRSGERRTATAHLQGDYFLLGLAQGHWEIPRDALNRIDLPPNNPGDQSINLGIAIVIPAKIILAVLNHPELESMRQR